MKILILGETGMLGSNFINSWKGKYEIYTTYRKNETSYNIKKDIYNHNRYFNVNPYINDNHIKVINDCNPDFVVNCIGITKNLINENLLPKYEYINSIFPHELVEICSYTSSKLILLSTDCVFSGNHGNYNESSFPDAEDNYGISKIKGEVSNNHRVITFRKSTIGLESSTNHGLLEWYLAQENEILGYSNAIFTGLITTELASAIELVMNKFPNMSGLFNIAGEPISKYILLKKINKILKRNIKIIPDSKFLCDRSLDGSKFNKYSGYTPPSWDEMLYDLGNQIKEKNDI